MIETLSKLDQKIFLFLNGLHHDGIDPIMTFFSAKLVWVPLYLAIIYFLIRIFKKKAVVLLIALILSVVAADRFTSGFMKPYFERPRPCHEALLKNQVHQVGRCGGSYGFASSHAANTFALATFMWVLFRKRQNKISLLLVWATIVSYSRIYLGVHYPGDIIVGATIGALFASITFYLQLYLQKILFKEDLVY